MAKRTKATKETKAPNIERELPFTDKGVYITKDKPSYVNLGEEVTFTAHLINIDEADVASYEWLYNEESTTATLTKSFDAPKGYTPQVVVHLNDGTEYASNYSGSGDILMRVQWTDTKTVEINHSGFITHNFNNYAKFGDEITLTAAVVGAPVKSYRWEYSFLGTPDTIFGTNQSETLTVNADMIKAQNVRIKLHVEFEGGTTENNSIYFKPSNTEPKIIPELYFIVDEYEETLSEQSAGKLLVIAEITEGPERFLSLGDLYFYANTTLEGASKPVQIWFNEKGSFVHDDKQYVYGYTNAAKYANYFKNSKIITEVTKGALIFKGNIKGVINGNETYSLSNIADLKVIKRSDIDLSKPESETFIPLAKFAESWNTFILPAHERDMHKINKLIVDKAITSHTQLQSELMKVPELKKYGVNYKSTSYNLTLRDERNSRYWLLDEKVNKDNLLYPRANNQRNHKNISYAVGDMFTQNTKLWIR
ncbi:TPA: hypothetical protein ACMDXI_001020 [Vibrio parahaemolyticus]